MFRIDISRTHHVNIFLVIVRDQININFQPGSSADTREAYIARTNFIQLQNKFNLPHRRPYVRGADSEHIKRHHGIFAEIENPHRHISFDQDITPTLLAEFLEELLKAQKETSDSQFQFITPEVATYVLFAFTSFY